MSTPAQSVTAAGAWRQLLPREHGGWGLLLQPFVAGALLGGLAPDRWLPAIGFLLFGFALRAPLLFVARAWLFRRNSPSELRAGALVAALEAALIAICLGALWPLLSPAWRAGVAGGGLLFTFLTLWIALENRQRSRAFQTLSAAALALSAPLALQLARGAVPAWGWALWLVFVLHAAVAIQLVHERLERRVAARNIPASSPGSKPFLAAVAVQLAAGTALAAGDPRWMLPPLLSSGYALAEWRTLRRPEALREPLRRVGWRTLLLSAAHLACTVAAFWNGAARSP